MGPEKTEHISSLTLSLSPSGMDVSDRPHPTDRPGKGRSLLMLPDNFTVFDTETTGLSWTTGDIIEFAAIRIRDGKPVETFQTFINPGYDLSPFTEDLTGITDKMLRDAPKAEEALPLIFDFLGDDIVMAHNAHFDVNFLYDSAAPYGLTFQNDFVDTLRLAIRAFPEMKHRKLHNLVSKFKIDVSGLDAHRALDDCKMLLRCYAPLKAVLIEKYKSEKNLSCMSGYRFSQTVPTPGAENNPITPAAGKIFVFTGKLDSMTRSEAAQIAVNYGGKVEDGVTKRTNYLVLGSTDYCSSLNGAKSSKQFKTEKLIAEGQDLVIITEAEFLEMTLYFNPENEDL
nr:MAG TPA: DNA polymerase III subunit alpha [Caudoviricetes sp.]